MIRDTDYPTIQLAMEIIANDQGLSGHPCHLGEIDFANEEIRVDLPRVEAALAKLSRADLETVCIGEQEEQVRVTHNMVDGAMVHRALETIFEECGNV